MADIHNVEAQKVNLNYTQGETIDTSFSVELNDVAYDMTGMQIDLEVYQHDELTRSFSSAGTSPEITISTSTFNINDTGFADIGRYEYYTFLTDGTTVMMFMEGDLIVKKRKKASSLVVNIIGTDALTHDGTTGSAAVTVVGGIEPYSYNWTGGTGPTHNGHAIAFGLNGTYEGVTHTCTVTDSTPGTALTGTASIIIYSPIS